MAALKTLRYPGVKTMQIPMAHFMQSLLWTEVLALMIILGIVNCTGLWEIFQNQCMILKISQI